MSAVPLIHPWGGRDPAQGLWGWPHMPDTGQMRLTGVTLTDWGRGTLQATQGHIPQGCPWEQTKPPGAVGGKGGGNKRRERPWFPREDVTSSSE